MAKEIARYFGAVSISPLDYQCYRCENRSQIDFAVVGVDNNRSRWAVQIDDPHTLVCGGTERAQVTVSSHGSAQETACVGCIYTGEDPEPSDSQAIPTVSFVSAFGGFLMAAEVLKTKLSALNSYKLDLLLDVDGLRSSSMTVRRPSKSPDCKCQCSMSGRFRADG